MKTRKNNADEDVKKGEPYPLLVGVYASTAAMETSLEAFQKSENRTFRWPSWTTSWHVPKGLYSATETLAHPCLQMHYSQ